MARFRITAEIELEVQASDEDEARINADAIIEKKLVGQDVLNVGEYADQGEITAGEVTGVELIETDDRFDND